METNTTTTRPATRAQEAATRTPEQQREPIREMYQRQIREVRERPQERSTGRSR